MLVALCLGLSPAMAPRAPAQGDRPVPSSAAARTLAFLTAVNAGDSDRILEFFPTQGQFTYLHTVHLKTGDRRGVWRFPAEQKGAAIQGPLWAPFGFQPESQPVGLFAHQVMMRGLKWHRASGTRFVPPGETASSDIFVEWRREGSKWVVSSFGDEGFSELPLPRWMSWDDKGRDLTQSRGAAEKPTLLHLRTTSSGLLPSVERIV